MGRAGLEHPLTFPSNSPISGSRGIKSGNTGADSVPEPSAAMTPDPDLMAVAAAWASLPPAIRAGIVAMVAVAQGSRR